MNKNPKISLITPCFNAAQYIEQTILSIINQDYDNIEYIIIDGGSTDGTVDIIKKYEDKITFWVSEPDKGQSDAINKGIQKASGAIFNWINADDYLEPNVLKLIANEFQDNSIDVLCSPCNLVNEKGDFLRVNEATHVDWEFQRLMLSQGLNQQGMFWKFDVIKQLTGVNPVFNYSMDLDLWKRYLLSFGISKTKKIDIITANFRLLESSKTGADFEVNFKLFEIENNAALQMYAGVLGDRFKAPIQYLFPEFNENIASSNIQKNIPKLQVENWLKEFFFDKAKRFFYANDFKNTYSFIKLLPMELFSEQEKKNLKSFKRWSSIKRWFQKKV